MINTGDPTYALMHNGRVIIKECPSCLTSLGLDAKTTGHNISIGSFGVTVSPGWCCPECGLEGKIKNSNVIVTGRKRIPPTGAMNALRNPLQRAAIVIDSDEFSAILDKQGGTESNRYPNPDPDDCPQRRKHGYYARVKETCPVCGGTWHETEMLTDEDIEELRASYGAGIEVDADTTVEEDLEVETYDQPVTGPDEVVEADVSTELESNVEVGYDEDGNDEGEDSDEEE